MLPAVGPFSLSAALGEGGREDVIRKLDDLFLPRKKERRRDSEIDTQKKDASKREGAKEENRRRLLNSTGFFMEQSVWKFCPIGWIYSSAVLTITYLRNFAASASSEPG